MVIALVAVMQMGQSRHQTKAMRDQVEVIRATAADELQASIAQGEAVREAARAQLQPIVFAHGYGPPRSAAHLPVGSAVFRYYLKNEGVGPALDVEHGVRFGQREHTVDDQKYRYRTLSSGEEVPPGYPKQPDGSPIEVEARHNDEELLYWARFSNVFGERFETRNYLSASKPAEFLRIEASEPS